MHSVVASHQNEIRALCRAYGVARLEVFGSAARAHDFDTTRSDIDFLLVLDTDREPAFTMNDYLDFREALCDLLGRAVDLVMEHSVRNPYVRAQIENSRELVHAA